MTVTINPTPDSGSPGILILISGTVWPASDSVQVGLSSSPAVPPIRYTQIVAQAGTGIWMISLAPTWSGLVYVWAQQVTPANPRVSLSLSRDRGYSFDDECIQSLGALGKRQTIVQFWRLGLGRDVVFRLRWSSPSRTALQGAFIEIEPSAT